MSGWLPPGCTDTDIDNAAPQDGPDDEELHSIADDCASIRYAFDRIISRGAKATAMLLIEEIMDSYGLDKFITPRHYRGEDSD